MTEQDVQNWLDEYGRAWVNGDPYQLGRVNTIVAHRR